MALVPVIQPPIMRALTTKKERMIRMAQIVPAMLKEIETEAFAGIGAESVMLTESVERVDADAFENCPQLKTFIVCGAETEIDNRALSGCDEVIVYAPDGSPAEKFAEYNKFSFIPLVNQPA